MSRVKRKLEERHVVVPKARMDDPFAEFRQIMLLELDHQFTYRHSLGKTSRFFLNLEEGKLSATRCPHCGKIWLPPRPVCPNDLTVTGWMELSGKGTLYTWTLCPIAPTYADADGPYILAYVALEEATSLFLQQLRKADVRTLYHGMPVKAVFSEDPVQHPLNLFWFEPY